VSGSTTVIVAAAGVAQVSVAVNVPVPNAAPPENTRATEAPETGDEFVIVRSINPFASVV